MNLTFVSDTPLNRDSKYTTFLSLDAQRFWREQIAGSGDVNGCVTVSDDQKMVGFFRYSVDRYHAETVVWAVGTWVEPERRRQNLAYQMWESMLLRERPTVVHVHCTSEEGYSLCKRLESSFHWIAWSITREKSLGPVPKAHRRDRLGH